ncbi:MAG TPA: NAD(P)H-dependent glycerol-3-phosphate dehydrogenase, partial [Planctomicrobium sp.]|nr:NAD(P)H-dependent glycerol-3-phosphate dehydrogenase [Planctomicrobium sp.]
GIENDTFSRPSQIIQQVLGQRDVVALVGPSHAEEIARRLPCSVVAACPNLDRARRVQDLVTTDRFRVYTIPDLIGAELAGALKNVISLAAGMCDGLGFGDNAKSTLMTRGMVEITRFGVALGAEPETFAGLAGLGDLITSCTSRHGRNRKVGEMLGQGKTLDEILGSVTFVAEGVSTSRAVHFLAQKLGVELPIIEQIYRVLFEGVTPLEATETLMRRPTGDE